MDNFTPYDFSKLAWRQSPEDPTSLYRDLSGGELWHDLSNRTGHGHGNLFLVLSLSLRAAIPKDELFVMAMDSWIELRNNIPTIAAKLMFKETTEGREGGRVYITYRSPQNEEDVQEWARRTVRIYEDSQDLSEIRVALGQKQIPDEGGDGTILYIVPQLSATSYGFIIHSDHISFDGSGIKIVMTHFLNLMCKRLEHYPECKSKLNFHWGEELRNILPPAWQLLVSDESKEGPEYFQSLSSLVNDTLSVIPMQYGLKTACISSGPGITQHISMSLSIEIYTRLQTISRALGLSLNQIAHAAMCLVCIDENPPSASTPSNAALVFRGIMNGRPRLLSEYRGNFAYPGYCVSVSPLVVPISAILELRDNIVDHSGRDKIHADESMEQPTWRKRVLLGVTEIIRREYVKQKSRKNLMAVTPQFFELMVAQMSTTTKESPWNSPTFVGDGIGEAYLTPIYTDQEGKMLIDVKDFFVSVNMQNPSLSFRAFSWRDKLVLNIDFNQNHFEDELMQDLMHKWAKWIEALVCEDKTVELGITSVPST